MFCVISLLGFLHEIFRNFKFEKSTLKYFTRIQLFFDKLLQWQLGNKYNYPRQSITYAPRNDVKCNTITSKGVITHHNVYHSVFAHFYKFFINFLSTVTNTCALLIQIATRTSCPFATFS